MVASLVVDETTLRSVHDAIRESDFR